MDEDSITQALPAADEVDENAGKVKVMMVQACTLRLDAVKTVFIPKGEQWLAPEIAGHWFVQHHTDNPPPKTIKPGTPEFAFEQARLAARDRLLDAAIDQAAEQGKLEGRAAAIAAADAEGEATGEGPVSPRLRRRTVTS